MAVEMGCPREVVSSGIGRSSECFWTHSGVESASKGSLPESAS
jgi:hypothetical protein